MQNNGDRYTKVSLSGATDPSRPDETLVYIDRIVTWSSYDISGWTGLGVFIRFAGYFTTTTIYLKELIKILVYV